MQELELDFVHRAGVKNKASNALSRLETTGDNERELEEEIPVVLLEATRQATCYFFETYDGLSEVNTRIPLVLEI